MGITAFGVSRRIFGTTLLGVPLLNNRRETLLAVGAQSLKVDLDGV
jgi:hypothetical protein